MSNSEPNADRPPQAEPQEAPAETGTEQPAQTQGFWQQPTEPMEREYRPIRERRSDEDRE